MPSDLERYTSAASPAEGRSCPHCGAGPVQVIKRGAITLTSDPDQVFWRGRRVPLSPTETHLFRAIAIRGRATFEAIDGALVAFGSNPATRAVVLLRIRRKFAAVGAGNPFRRLGNSGVALKIDEDRHGSTATIIGLQMVPDLLAHFANA